MKKNYRNIKKSTKMVLLITIVSKTLFGNIENEDIFLDNLQQNYHQTQKHPLNEEYSYTKEYDQIDGNELAEKIKIHLNNLKNQERIENKKDSHKTKMEIRLKQKLLEILNNVENKKDKEKVVKLINGVMKTDSPNNSAIKKLKIKRMFITAFSNATSKTGIICITMTLSLAHIRGIITSEEFLLILRETKNICVIIKDTVRLQGILSCIGKVMEFIAKFSFIKSI